MGWRDILGRLFGTYAPRGDGTGGIREFAHLLGLNEEELRAVPVAYREFSLPKRSGGRRLIHAPEPPLKKTQRRIRCWLSAYYSCHPAARGFVRAHSIVTNAREHVGKAVVVRMDIRDFFPSIKASQVADVFNTRTERSRTGQAWSSAAVNEIVRLCTYRGCLPAGAPTSPHLSNLVCFRLDARLDALAKKFGATYTRYADDLTFSFVEDAQKRVHTLIGLAQHIVRDFGFEVHTKRKLVIARRGDRQLVTGLVVNERVNLPRRTRRWLRAVEHRAVAGRPTTLTPAQLAGWRALAAMVAKQRGTQPSRS